MLVEKEYLKLKATEEQWIKMYKYIIFTKGVTGVPCQGDSGGPLVCRKSPEHAWQQFGLTSWGLACTAFPNAFSRISTHFTWIWDIIEKYDADESLNRVNKIYSLNKYSNKCAIVYFWLKCIRLFRGLRFLFKLCVVLFCFMLAVSRIYHLTSWIVNQKVNCKPA